jgi:pyruvate dehydrogenase (quinone)
MGSLAFVELEMAGAGIVNYATDLGNANVADIARASGLHGVRPDELEAALPDAPVHAGPAVIDIVTARQNLSRPPKLTFEQIKGFTLYASRTILSGRADEIVELAKTHLRDLGVE